MNEKMKKIGKTINRRNLKSNLQSYAMLFPGLVLFLAFSIYPCLWTLKYMFYRYGGVGTGEPKFVGLENFFRVFRDKVYWESVRNTFVYAGGKILIILPLAFLVALILNKKRKGNGALQAVVFMPTIMSSAVMGMVFYLLFNVYNGQINRYLLDSGLVSAPVNWLGKEHAMQTVIITAIWGGLGNYMVYFLAGLQQISEDILESAKIDGANKLQTIWFVMIPMLGPILKIILMIAITSAFTDMSSIMVLTEGGPNNATMVMALYGYQYFFPISSTTYTPAQYGYGAAIGVVSAMIAGVVTILYLKLSRKLDAIY